MPSYLGVFIDSLAMNVEHLYLFMHEGNILQNECDYAIQQKNVSWINLGLKTAAWHRAFFPYKSLKKFSLFTSQIDIFLVRAPSPLAPYFYKMFNCELTNYLIVGDYRESVNQGTGNGIRNRVIDLFLLWNDMKLYEAVRSSKVIVNSAALFKKYDGRCKKLFQIKTTTLTKQNITIRSDSFNYGDDCINLLYTGRINWQKGLKELFESISQLVKYGYNLKLHIVGWEDDINKPIEKSLQLFAIQNGFAPQVFFYGRKKAGDELLAYYRNAQIYILPTYHEGFPRTIWESMASGTPVISTSVGSIPFYLTSEENCLLVSPRDSGELTQAIVRIINDSTLRKKIIANSYDLVKECTLEIQSARLVGLLQE